jgi:hypothetical protein
MKEMWGCLRSRVLTVEKNTNNNDVDEKAQDMFAIKFVKEYTMTTKVQKTLHTCIQR